MPRAPEHFQGRWLELEEEREAFATHSGILHALPSAVAIPEHAGDVQRLVRWAAATGTPLVPRGAGTGMPGGNVGPGVVVDLVSGFRRIEAVRAGERRVTVEPGVTLAAVNAAAAPARLHLPVDPSSGESCTIGGMVANNSAGAHSVRHGAMRPWIQALEVILATGERVEMLRGDAPTHDTLRSIQARLDDRLAPHRAEILEAWPRVRKNSSGYALREYLLGGDLLELIVGSEGTLAVVTRAELRLAPVPAHRAVALLEFDDLEAAGAAIPAILAADPATCEMLDRTFLDLVRGGGGDAAYPLREGLEAILIVEAEEGTERELRSALERIRDAAAPLAKQLSIAKDPEGQRRFWELRHAASPLIARHAGNRVSMQFIEDGVVPIDRLPEYVTLLRTTLRRHDLPAVIFGHAGDGNLHVNPLVDVTEPRWRESIAEVLDEIAAGIARLGGTLSGEHGDGRLRAPLLDTVWGAQMVAHFRFVKETFDPAGILNPGVILPLPGQTPFEALRSYR